MDDVFLYNHIKQAIKQRKQFAKDPEEGNFAQTYCRRQLMKKKLNFDTNMAGNPKSKMKSLMKNFSHVETYVDLNELLYSINLIREKQLAERKISQLQQKHRMSRISRINDISAFSKAPLSHFREDQSQPTIDPMAALKDRFRGQINDKIKRRYMIENNDMNDIVEYLEKESHLNNSLLKNNSTNYLCYLNQQLEKIQNNDEQDAENQLQNQKIFKQLTHTLSEPSFQRQSKKEYFKSTNLNSKQKKEQNQLLHKISTFLQIALQNQHKEKWTTKDIKKFRSTHGSFRFKKGKDQRSKFFLKGIQIQKQNKQIFQTVNDISNSRSMSRKNTIKKNQNFLKKIKSEQRNIFGKRSIEGKNSAMNQTGNLMQTGSHWNFPDNKKWQNKQNLSLFKLFDKKNIEQRKTAPVNSEDLFKDFTRTIAKDFESTNNTSYINQVKPKKEYLLNKQRKQREYNFITPGRNNFHYKTVMVHPLNSQIPSDKHNETCTQGFRDTDNNIIERQQAIHTDFICEQPKISTFSSDKNLKTTSHSLFKRSTSTKNTNISQAFTFKKRGKKQQIMNKLQSFIQQINNQQKNSKMENEYYDSAINQLHDLSKTTYKNYEPEALAGYEEISELKRFVNAINPSLRKNHSKKKTMVR